MLKFLVLLSLLLLQSQNTFGDSTETATTTSSQEDESSSPTTPHAHFKSGEELQSAHNQRLPLKINGGVVEFTTEAPSSTSSTTASTTFATTTAVKLQTSGTESSNRDPTSPPSQSENEECVDNAENCLPNIIYCKQGGYISLMQKHCSKTCGLCKKEAQNGTTPRHPVFSRPVHRERTLTRLLKRGQKTVDNDSEQCEDTSPRCGLWNVHKFCNSKFFQLDIKKKFCLKTCKLCPKDKKEIENKEKKSSSASENVEK